MGEAVSACQATSGASVQAASRVFSLTAGEASASGRGRRAGRSASRRGGSRGRSCPGARRRWPRPAVRPPPGGRAAARRRRGPARRCVRPSSARPAICSVSVVLVRPEPRHRRDRPRRGPACCARPARPGPGRCARLRAGCGGRHRAGAARRQQSPAAKMSGIGGRQRASTAMPLSTARPAASARPVSGDGADAGEDEHRPRSPAVGQHHVRVRRSRSRSPRCRRQAGSRRRPRGGAPATTAAISAGTPRIRRRGAASTTRHARSRARPRSPRPPGR